MSIKNRRNPWMDEKYRKFESVQIQNKDILISFENGDSVKIEKNSITPNHAKEIFWDKLTFDAFEIKIPTTNYLIEIPWDKIRVLTDKSFAKFLAGEAEEEAKIIGKKIRQLRESKKISAIDLADRASLTPQTISRIERGHTDVGFVTLKRILAAMGCSLSDLAKKEDSDTDKNTKSLSVLVKRMKNIGIDEDLLFNKIIPRNIADSLKEYNNNEPELLLNEATSYLDNIYGWKRNEIWEKADLKINRDAFSWLYFKKPFHSNLNQIKAYTHYAYYLSKIVLRIKHDTSTRRYPKDLDEFKKNFLKEYKKLSLENLIEYIWDFGIAVLPLNDSGIFHGAAWNINGNHIIVLKQNTKYHARWIFDLLHEVYHIFAHLDNDNSGVIEEEELNPISNSNAKEELEANTFANHFIFGTNPELFAKKCLEDADWKMEKLKQAVKDIAKYENIEVDFLANYLAFRLSYTGQNWWGTASKLQINSPKPFDIAAKTLKSKISMENLNAIDFNLLNSAIKE